MSELKEIPYDIEAEQSAIGTLIADPDTIDEAADLLSADDFYRRDNRLVFSAILELHADGSAPDVITLGEQLRGQVAVSYIGGLVRNAYNTSNIKAYAESVRRASICRQISQVGRELIALAGSRDNAHPDEVIDRAQSLVMGVAESARRGRSGPVAYNVLVPAVLDDLEARHERGVEICGVPTGFRDFDRLTAGLQPADLVVLAGRPSMGKSALAMNIAERVAATARVAVFSLEMPRKQIVERSLCSTGRIDMHRVRTGQLDDADWGRVTQAQSRLMDCGLHLDDSAALTVTELAARCRRLHRQGPLSLVVVDYLQLMRAPGRTENRTAEISEISRGLKSLAKELNVPVIALSQLNRALEQRHNKRPVMSDLRESGAIEQDADVIVFIYRDEVYDPNSHDAGTAELIIGKHRNGPTGMVRLTFIGRHLRFEDCAYQGSRRRAQGSSQRTFDGGLEYPDDDA